ncbi:flagellar basal-body MS-ring/collar protein FliF [Sulfuritalea hydrogenivorans]|jgi:flagellar M-ring protein FliF|nr:flagellar basal-body MS-ring/collar protein FliF [Sulfuritalea hydrogenivorans]MDK9715031.1 flagellar basal-body MS-ring/collar protein FliF [Sulfuritalea sp.]
MAENTATADPISMEAFLRLAPRQKLMGMVGVALFVAVLVGGWLWTKEPPYALLFTIQDEKDGGQIVAALSQQNIPYRFSDGGRGILVPQSVVHDTRLKLASQGLPKGGLVGFELMETQKLGVSQFAEQINYQRALEGELARSIQSLAAVRGARVHLAIPKQTAFLRDDQKTSASVLVSLHPGRTLDQIQVAGIINLVASSVPQLSSSNVSVIDQEGKLISQQRDPQRNAGLDATQLKFLREVEADYGKRIETILVPLVGPNNVRAQVTADLDFSQIDQVAESYKPNPANETAIRSQQTAEVGSGSPQAAGVPGALSNQPPVPATAPLTQSGPGGPTGAAAAANPSQNFTRNATINYEVDKTIRHTKGVPGTVRRLSVAVVVNHRKDPTKPKPVPLTPAELKQITDLAREAMGFSKDRGDTLNVANAPFTPAEKEVIADAPIWANQELIATLKELARYLLIAGAAFWLWTRLLKPVFEKLMEPPPPRLAPEKQEFEVGADGMLHRHRSYDEKLADAREIAKKDPKAVANMIKEWVDGGEHGK